MFGLLTVNQQIKTPPNLDAVGHNIIWFYSKPNNSVLSSFQLGLLGF